MEGVMVMAMAASTRSVTRFYALSEAMQKSGQPSRRELVALDCKRPVFKKTFRWEGRFYNETYGEKRAPLWPLHYEPRQK